MFNLINFFLLTFLFWGCSQPKYINSVPTDANQNSPQESKADCSTPFQTSSSCVSLQWETKPTSSTMGSFIFKVYRLNSFDQTAIEIDLTSIPQVVLWMPSMGHGSSPTHVERLDVGTFRVSNVFFIMPGEWEIKFQVKEGSVVSDEAVIPFIF